MASLAKSEVSERLAEMERMDRQRIWESAVSPLATPKPANASETVGVDLVIERFGEMEKSIANLRKELQAQVAIVANRNRQAWWWRMAVVAIASGMLGVGLIRLIHVLRPPALISAARAIDDL